MLVGVLTTAVIGGAALIEKAKIQKVIEDIDYYEKAFVQFTIQFGQAPGTLTLKRCEENIEVFKKCMEYQANKISNLDSGVLYDSLGHFMFAPLQLATAGYINTTEYNMEEGFIPTGRTAYNYNYLLKGMKVNYTKTARAEFYSKDTPYRPTRYGEYETLGVIDYFELNRKKYNEGFFLTFEDNSNKSRTKWNSRIDGLFSPKMLEKIDKKVDDGLPRKGKVQAIKQGTISNMKQICYDRSRDEDEAKYPAKYINSNKVKQGCDLLYYLTDVSGYTLGY